MVVLHIKLKGVTKCSNMVANILLPDPLPPSCPGDWVNRSKFQLFQNMVMLKMKFNGITKCSNMVADILPGDPHSPTPPAGIGSIGQISTFSEHGQVAFQIKWNHEMQQHSSTYVDHRPPTSPYNPRGWDQKVKIHLLQNMVMMHIKLKGITNAAIW